MKARGTLRRLLLSVLTAGMLLQGTMAAQAAIPSAGGSQVQRAGAAAIDYSNVSEGYVMVSYGQNNGKRVKAQVKGPSTTYTYDIQPNGQWEALPLSDNNGGYTVTVFENVEGTSYATIASASFNVSLNDPFRPFLYSNQYVNYAAAPNTVNTAASLCSGKGGELEKVDAVYTYVISNISYDTALAASVSSGYLPVLDNVLARRQGICFDYAALMAGMLRSQGVPTKLVVGYAGSVYHAWISVWTAADGWIEGVIYFDGNNWHRMDPTFASTGGQSQQIMQYIGNGSNYSAKYFY